jgi:hypothetical protein
MTLKGRIFSKYEPIRTQYEPEYEPPSTLGRFVLHKPPRLAPLRRLRRLRATAVALCARSGTCLAFPSYSKELTEGCSIRQRERGRQQ